MNDILYRIALKKMPLIGDITAKKLINHFGSAENVFAQKRQNLEKVIGIGTRISENFASADYLRQAEAELTFCQQHNIRIFTYTDPDYPALLGQCLDSPVVFYQRGNVNLTNKRILSVVGTRQVTPYGIATCEQLIEALAPLGVVVVSGFAYGVDITAHKAAVKHKLQTVACLAHGLHIIYPKVHSKYCAEIEYNGGFITDFGHLCDFDRKNFLARNRIIAGLAEAMVVIESGHKGGSLVTADIANAYGREVFAVPGRITDTYSTGCNELIASGKAHALLSAESLIERLQWRFAQPKAVQQQLFFNLSGDEQRVYDFLKAHGKQTLDELASALQQPIYQLSPLLVQLEMKGALRPLPGKMFESVG